MSNVIIKNFSVTHPMVWPSSTGETITFDDALYPLVRSGVFEDAWFTLSYSPLRDESGAVARVLVTLVETTAHGPASAR